MEYGAHLPLIDFDGEVSTLAKLLDFTETVEELGYRFLCANDYFVFFETLARRTDGTRGGSVEVG